jgi:hypothetical protein
VLPYGQTNADDSLTLYTQKESPGQPPGSQIAPGTDGYFYTLLPVDWPDNAEKRGER